MSESIQRILANRALARQTPANPTELICWLEATARAWTPIPRHSNGLANAKLVATERIEGVIHSADPEPTQGSQSFADFNLWTNGHIPVK
jgi:hypothetical protein